MNIANVITLLRILLIPIFIGVLIVDFPNHTFWSAVIFIVLAVSDWLDGYLARKHKLTTNFGKLIDPMADKILVAAALIFLIGKGVDAWMVFLIITREFVVTTLRLGAQSQGITIAASEWGKIKTISQMIAIPWILFGFPYGGNLMLVATVLTVVSGIDYFWKSRSLFPAKLE
ncbi:MAG: CDP-diacylglycerol--glycerol-3-phosphate 3-phosphatidyltransferase [Nanoarchaeota archaeon]|nr:CDP-diacylglycerol--glycerol-3-phosphate 3-phosphatidyltransferase [Nanoarchaeota archaeon]